MSNAAVTTLSWLAVIAHISVGILAWRLGSPFPLLPIINLVTAGCVVLYWIPRWTAALSKGTTIYASDQLLPAYAIAVCVVSVLALTGRASWNGLHWFLFAIHSIACIAAALFFSSFKMNRLF